MNKNNILALMHKIPSAVAVITGGAAHPCIYGTVKFYQTGKGVVVLSEIMGLPTRQGSFDSPILALHIHSGSSCTGNAEDSFANALTHYNPKSLPHPYHAGDLPPLFSADGTAFSAVLTDRFTVDEIIGKTVIIHDSYDDFTTQPAGNSGKKIACGEIRLVRR